MTRYYVSVDVRAKIDAKDETEAYGLLMAAFLYGSDRCSGNIDVRGSNRICVTEEDVSDD